MRVVYAALASIHIPFMTMCTDPNYTLHRPVGYTPWDNISYLFAHGLGATQAQAHALLPTNNHYWILNKPLALFDFPDARPNPLEYNREFVNLGQQLDIDRLRFAFCKTQQELPSHEFVLAGISRGAVTIMNYMGIHADPCVKALVLESPFDTFKNVVEHLLKRFHVGWLPFSKKIALKYVKKTFPNFDVQGLFPKKTISSIPAHLPIILIHSLKDKTIPVKSAYKLYLKLVTSGHQHVYLLVLPHGEHGKLLQGPSGELYQNTVHAFYKQYNLPHEAEFALRGHDTLKLCQPSLEEIRLMIKKRSPSEEGDMDSDLFMDQLTEK